MTIDNFSSLEIQNTQTQGNTKRCQINQKVQLVLISEDKMYFQNSKYSKRCQIKPLRKVQYFQAIFWFSKYKIHKHRQKKYKEVPDKTITKPAVCLFSSLGEDKMYLLNTKYTNTNKRNTKKCQINH